MRTLLLAGYSLLVSLALATTTTAAQAQASTRSVNCKEGFHAVETVATAYEATAGASYEYVLPAELRVETWGVAIEPVRVPRLLAPALLPIRPGWRGYVQTVAYQHSANERLYSQLYGFTAAKAEMVAVATGQLN